MVYVHEFDTLQETAQKILEEAKSQGVDSAQIVVSSTENIATRFGESHITQNTQSNSLQFALRSVIGEQIGSYYGTVPTDDNLSKMVSNALELVNFSPPDPEFPGFITEQPEYPDLDREIIEYTPSDIADAIKIGIDAALSTGSKIDAVAGSINYNATRDLLANSYGVEATSENSTISGILNIAAVEGESESRSSDSIAGRKIEDLAFETVAPQIADRATRGLNQGELEVGKYESILGHSAMMELMFHLGLATSSEMLINHQSPFKDKLGEKLFDERLTITDATGDVSHYASQKFDYDGVPSPTLTFIENGILKEFAYNRRNAQKLGVETNGRAAGMFAIFRSPTITPGNKSEEELIASIDDGVYVSNLWYSNFVNMPDASITGLTRDGLFKIEGGEIVGSVKNMRFTDTLYSMFEEAEPANNQLMKLHGTYGNMLGLAGKLPSIRIGNFNFSSKGKH